MASACRSARRATRGAGRRRGHRLGEGPGFPEGCLTAVQGNVDVEPLPTRGLHAPREPQPAEQVPEDERHPGTRENPRLLAGIEIEDHGIGCFRSSGSGQWHVEFEGREVCYPEERLRVVDQADRHLLAVTPENSGRLHPGGAMGRAALLEEEWFVHAFGIALQGQGPVL